VLKLETLFWACKNMPTMMLCPLRGPAKRKEMIVSHWPMATMIGPGDDNISLVSHFISSSPCSSLWVGLQE
jgi:hypothetical protein